jgi:hypothetical protein
LEDANSGDIATLRIAGEIEVEYSITAGNYYYISDSSPNVTATPRAAKSGSNDVLQRVGYAKNNNTIIIQIDHDFTIYP